MKKVTYILSLLLVCISLTGFSISSVNTSSIKNNIKSVELDNTTIDWFFIPNDKSETPEINDKLTFKLSDYNAIYTGPKIPNKKSLYLTFDEGYEEGYSNKILDVLKEKNVKATFFVTSYYISSSPDIVKRMVEEGHVVANHSMHHYSMPSVTYSADVFNKEISDVETRYKELTKQDMPKLFRPPMGKYSQKSLAMTNDLGYKTVFWSFAYGDYEPANQPSPGYAKQHILSHLHDGGILLLHAVSKTNSEILGEVIDEARNKGYEFYLLP